MKIDIEKLRSAYDSHMKVPSGTGFIYGTFPVLLDAYEERDRLRQLLAEVLPRLKRIASGRSFSDIDLIRRAEEAIRL